MGATPTWTQNDFVPQTILVVDDEPIVREVVVRYLERDGYRTLEAGDGHRARELVEQGAPDLVVLDVMLPGPDGLALCRWIRERSRLPVIMLTARGEESDRIVGLELGADDYVAKPFSPRELVARVRTILRRAHRPVETPAAPAGGPFVVDAERHQIRFYGRALELSRYEYGLLRTLIHRPGRVYTCLLYTSDAADD